MKKFELNIGYDSDLGRVLWKDFLNQYRHLKFNDDTGLSYIVLFGSDAEYLASAFSSEYLESKTDAELFDLAFRFDFNTQQDRNGVIADLLTVTQEAYYCEHYKNTDWRDLDCDFVSRGYSQGEAVAVKLIDFEISQSDFDNLLWDSPIYGILTIYESFDIGNKDYLADIEWVEVEEVLLSEYLEDAYYWDKEAFLANYKLYSIDADKDAIFMFLETELPEQLGSI